MSDLYNRIESLCKVHKISVTKMCTESGANRASLTDLKMGRKNTLSAETLSMISSYFGISIEALLGKDTHALAALPRLQELRDEERALLQVTKGMTTEQIKIMTEFAKSMKGQRE